MQAIMKKTIIFLFLFQGILLNAQDAKKSNSDHIFSTNSWEQILQQAQKENKLIFIDLYFEGCHPCAEMEADVYPNPKVATVLKKDFISFKSDVFKEQIGMKLSMKYAVTGFPTLLILTPKMELLDIASGFRSVDEFSDLLADSKKYANQKKYKNFSTSFELDYPDFYRASYMENKRDLSFEEIDTYLKQQKSLSDEIPFAIITGLRLGGVYQEYIFDNAQQLANDYGRMTIRNSLITIVINRAKILGKENDLAVFNKVLKESQTHFYR